MLKKLTPDQLSKILEKLPEDLKEAFFSIESTEKMSEICEKYEIPAEKIPFVVNYVGQVLLGILSPEELEAPLEKEVGLQKEVARSASQQIYRYIFFPVKESLSALSGSIQVPPSPERKEKIEEGPSLPRPDTYREPIE